MISIIIFAIIIYIIIDLIVYGYISKPDFASIMASLMSGIFLTVILSLTLYLCNVGEFKTTKTKNYEEIYITEEDCKIKFINIDADGSYKIENNEYDLRNCKFIDDNTQQVEYQRWTYGKILDWFFTVPLYNHYIIHK